MIPIQDLLHRVQWDPEFGKSEIVVGYHDRLSGAVVRVPLRRMRFPSGEHFAFEAVEDDGTFTMFRCTACARSGAMAS